MAWMMETFSHMQGHLATGVVTGKPVPIGGSLGRIPATGLGVTIALREVLTRQGESVDGKRFVVQGLGNVGRHAAREMIARGAVLAAVQDETSTVISRAGIDPDGLHLHKLQTGRLFGSGGSGQNMGVMRRVCWSRLSGDHRGQQLW